jgi:hypothetical protein
MPPEPAAALEDFFSVDDDAPAAAEPSDFFSVDAEAPALPEVLALPEA